MSDSLALTELDHAVSALRERAGAAATPRVEVDLEAVARTLGVEVADHTGVAEGRLCVRAGRVMVEVHPGLAPARRRFTLAHELGHAYLLHPERPLSGLLCRRWRSTESFCNDFAAALLLPRAWLESETRRRSESLEVLEAIARASGASLSACALRLLRTRLWTHALVEWRLSDDLWRIRSASALARSRRDSFSLVFPRTEIVTDDSPVWTDVRIMSMHGGQIVLSAHVWRRASSVLMLVPVETDEHGLFRFAPSSRKSGPV